MEISDSRPAIHVGRETCDDVTWRRLAGPHCVATPFSLSFSLRHRNEKKKKSEGCRVSKYHTTPPAYLPFRLLVSHHSDRKVKADLYTLRQPRKNKKKMCLEKQPQLLESFLFFSFSPQFYLAVSPPSFQPLELMMAFFHFLFYLFVTILPTCVLGWMLSQQDEMECRLLKCHLFFYLILADVAPPPYTRLGLNHDRPHRLPSYPVESLETGGTNQYSSTGSNLGRYYSIKISNWQWTNADL